MKKEILLLVFVAVSIYFLIQNFKRYPQEEIAYKYTKSLGEEIFELTRDADLGIIRGSGGCRTEEECVAFCNNSDNQEICFNFARQFNLLSDLQLKNIEESAKNIRIALDNVSLEVTQCITENINIVDIEKIHFGVMTPGSQAGEIIMLCFQEKKLQQDMIIYKKFINFLNNKLLNKI